MFYLSKNHPDTLVEEELALEVLRVPSNNARIKAELRAAQTVGNYLRQLLLLQASCGVHADKNSLSNAAGMVLQDDMSVRTAITLPPKSTVALAAGIVDATATPLTAASQLPSATSTTLFAVPIPPPRRN